MTHPHDPPRQWSRPVEEVARVLVEQQIRSNRRWDTEPKVLEMMLPTAINVCWRERALDAELAITRLISLGFINENGIEAMKAEKEGK